MTWAVRVIGDVRVVWAVMVSQVDDWMSWGEWVCQTDWICWAILVRGRGFG